LAANIAADSPTSKTPRRQIIGTASPRNEASASGLEIDLPALSDRPKGASFAVERTARAPNSATVCSAALVRPAASMSSQRYYTAI